MTSAATRRILVTRPQPAADEFAERLRREGFEAFVAPMTAYVEQQAEIGDMAQYQGIIFTSAQAVNTVIRYVTERYIPVFAVGDATARAADAAGFRRIYSAQGDAAALIKIIRERKDQHELKRMLHVSGEDTAEEFAEPLKEDGIYVDRVAVYKADFVSTLPKDAEVALAHGDIDIVTLFSARTATNFRRIVEQSEDLKAAIPDIELVCISDRVAAEVQDLPWHAITVTTAPHLEAVMEALRSKSSRRFQFSAMPADPVIEAFGGLRPLANSLNITASTVQGWKKRGVIPDTRVAAVLQAANDAGISTDLLWKEKGTGVMTDEQDGPAPKADAKTGEQQGAKKPAAAAENDERRRGAERRQRYTAPDARGHVSTDKYSGPDRRTGIDRRSYQQRQAERIAAEKWRFMNRSVVMGAFFVICGLYGAGFLLAPELFDFRRKTDNVEAMQAQVDQLNQRILALQKNKNSEILGAIDSKLDEREASWGQKLYNRLGEIEAIANQANEAVSGVTKPVGQAASAVGQAVVDAAGTTKIGQNLTAFIRVMSNLSTASKSKEGQASAMRGLTRLREVLATAPTDAKGLNAAVANALSVDKDLQKLLAGIDARDLGAAGLLLALNEFRSHISTSRSFEQDLLIMEKFLGDDPKMKKALTRLAPYAQRGVLNRQQLQSEFANLASDIVMAKLQGQDVSVKQQMLQRLSHLVKVRKIDDIEGNSVDATVARAQLLLNKGDVKGAMRELQTLEGAPAQTAQPFMDAAAGNVMAENASDVMLQNIMKQFTPDGGGAMDTATMQQMFDDVWNLGPAGLMPYISGGQRDTSVTSPYVGPDIMDAPMMRPDLNAGTESQVVPAE